MPAEATYFCIEEIVGGLQYSSGNKRWESAKFKPEAKFVLQLKLRGIRVEKNSLWDDKTVGDYAVTITNAGTNHQFRCDGGANKPDVVVWATFRTVMCSGYLTDYVFDLETNRFLKVYAHGYVHGDDNNENAPHIGGGTCTKIN